MVLYKPNTQIFRELAARMGFTEHCFSESDEILCRAVVEGCKLPIEAGIAAESAAFGDVCATQDATIGLQAFLAKEKPAFVHA